MPADLRIPPEPFARQVPGLPDGALATNAWPSCPQHALTTGQPRSLTGKLGLGLTAVDLAVALQAGRALTAESAFQARYRNRPPWPHLGHTAPECPGHE